MSSDEQSEEQPPARFTPRVEAEEGEPTRFDYVVLALVTLFIVLALLWALGVIRIPGVAV